LLIKYLIFYLIVMAKAKNIKEVKGKTKSDVVEINLDSLIIPISIIIAGVVIAAAIFITSNKNKDTNTDSANPTVAESDDSGLSAGDATVSLGDAPYLGNKDKTKIAIVEYSDFGCGYCKRHATEVYPELKSKFVDTGEIIYVFKSFPLSDSGISYNAAIAMHCVAKYVDGNKAAEFHSNAFNFTTDEEIKNGAIAVGVDASKYDSCIADSAIKSLVAAEKAEGGKAGIEGTPGFVVGKIDKDGNITGPVVKGAYPFTTFESAIKELSK